MGASKESNRQEGRPRVDMPGCVAVLGAAGGLGQAILRACRLEGIRFCAIVRSRPERISDVPSGSRVAVVDDLSDVEMLAASFDGVDAVLSAVGVTRSSSDSRSLLSRNLKSCEAAMCQAGVDRLLLISTLVAAAPGQRPSLMTRLFCWVPGTVGRGAAELQAVPLALGAGALHSVRWTLVRAGVHRRGKDVEPVAALGWGEGRVSMMPVSYDAMARWMLRESVADRFVQQAPLVSRPR